MLVKGCIALVTGANGGLGSTFVRHLLDSGATKVYTAARNTSSLSQLLALDSQRVQGIGLDITSDESVEACARECGDVTLLINNAGALAGQGFLQAASLSAARQEMEVNYFGLLRMCNTFGPILGDNGGGAIVNLLSVLAKAPIPLAGSYSASKAAALALTTSVRAELAYHRTLVVGVLPGTIDTPMSHMFPPPKVTPDEVVRAALAAVESGETNVYPGEQAQQLARLLIEDPAAVERQMAQFLPQAAANA